MRTIECCGKERAAYFCDVCGERLQDSPLAELVDYLLVRLKSELKASATHATELSRIKRAGEDADRCARREKWLRAAEARAAKWQSWITAVGEVM